MEHSIDGQLKSVLLYLLDTVDRICRENDIPYFLDSGTALGAVRHKGFIPWDDDIDIGMMRADYDRFLEVAPKSLPDDLVIQNEKNEPTYYLFFTKIRKLNTLYSDNRREKDFIYKGIQIDIFPFDYIADDPETAARIFDRAEKKRIIAEKRMVVIPPRNKLKRAAYHLLRLVPASFYRNSVEKMFRKHNDGPKKYVASYTYILAKKKRCIFPADAMVPVRETLFEGKNYMIMNDPDRYLKVMFGDYMKLPPEEERVPHHLGKEIVFDTAVLQ